MQCNTLCSSNENCYAIRWDETTHECTLLNKDGLCLEEDETKSAAVFVEDKDMCALLCQGILQSFFQLVI